MSYSPAKLDPTETKTDNEDQLKTTPSWFAEGKDPENVQALAEAYRASRKEREPLNLQQAAEDLSLQQKRLEERFQLAQKQFEPAANDVMSAPTSERARRPMVSAAVETHPERKRPARRQPPAQSQTRWGAMAAFGLIAVSVGSLAGFGIAERDQVMKFGAQGLQKVSLALPDFNAVPEQPKAPAVAEANQTVIAKKPVIMASLDVSDAHGALNTAIPLDVKTTGYDLRVSGLPDNAYLNVGTRQGSKDWLVKSADITQMKVVVPTLDRNQLDLEVAALDQKSGELAAPAKELTVALDKPQQQMVAAEGASDLPVGVAPPPDMQIQPVSAAPDGVTLKSNTDPAAALPEPDSKVAGLLAQGDGLMKSGDVVSARQFYLKASALGSAKGAFGVAQSYDAKVLTAMNITGLQPDPAKATEWYQKAAAGGVTTATP